MSLDFDEKLLDEGQLRLHLMLLETQGQDLSVTLKVAPHVSSFSTSLADLVAPLVQNSAFGGQVHYTLAGCRWLDTLISTKHGVRMVRLQLSS